MSDNGPGVLTGLVSGAAAEAFERLSRSDGLPVGPGPDGFDADDPVWRELVDAGVVTVLGSGPQRVVRAVHPTIAVRRLLDRQHRRLAELQTQLATTWERFAAMVPPTAGLAGGAGDPGADEVQVVRDHPEMTRLAAGLYRSPKRVLRATLNGHFASGKATEGVLLPPEDAIAAGVEFRMIYDVKHVSDTWGAYSVEQSVRAGEQARVRRTVPVRMMLVDDTVALVTIDESGAAGALHVRSPALLAVLTEWFDLLWDDPGSTVVRVGATGPAAGTGRAGAGELTPVQQKVLRMMASGLTDTAIAHQAGTSVRSVRRHVSAILAHLGAESRFAAGVAAAKRGWL
ncbi:helix-turn-helix transcriptional regulator [Saccharothrix hoggarensis]|uniref:Response regulator transcription factor n=1 Tax=Saccharothrix hoggarensis TaxID=913853 RepID=A0ABW3QRQ9_9PSEU